MSHFDLHFTCSSPACGTSWMIRDEWLQGDPTDDLCCPVCGDNELRVYVDREDE